MERSRGRAVTGLACQRASSRIMHTLHGHLKLGPPSNRAIIPSFKFTRTCSSSASIVVAVSRHPAVKSTANSFPLCEPRACGLKTPLQLPRVSAAQHGDRTVCKQACLQAPSGGQAGTPRRPGRRARHPACGNALSVPHRRAAALPAAGGMHCTREALSGPPCAQLWSWAGRWRDVRSSTHDEPGGVGLGHLGGALACMRAACMRAACMRGDDSGGADGPAACIKHTHHTIQ